MISLFSGNYLYLSNFYECSVEYDGVVYRCSGAAYFSKMHPGHEEQFSKFLYQDAEFYASTLPKDNELEKKKNDTMIRVLFAKFSQHDDLVDKLLDTGSQNLVYNNVWNDTYWGVCKGVGLNYLGRMLVDIRKAAGGQPVCKEEENIGAKSPIVEKQNESIKLNAKEEERNDEKEEEDGDDD